MAAKGERTWNSSGQEVVHFDNKPIAEDDYPLELLEEGLEIRKSEAQGPNAIPYVNCRFRAQGTAQKEGQKDRIVFRGFYLSLKPGADGVLNPNRGGGVVEFYRARGQEVDLPVKSKTIVTKDSDTGEETEQEVEYLDPEALLEQLKEWTGTVTRGHVAIEKPRDRTVNGKTVKADPNDPGKNTIEKWHINVAQEQPKKATGTGGTVTKLAKKK